MTLRRPRTQQLQVESFLAVQTVVNNMNCEFKRIEPDNSGIDAEIELVRNLIFQGQIVKAQIKAGHSYISSETKDHIRVKVEKKYVEHWQRMNVPVLLIFYNPDSKVLYWKSVKEYLKCDPKIIRRDKSLVIFPFDKKRDIFNTSVIDSLRLVVEERFKYDRIIYVEKDAHEELISNLFPVISLPQKIYVAPTPYRYHKDISNQLEDPYTFIVKGQRVHTFSNLHDPDCELDKFCDYESPDEVEIKSPDEIESIRYAELLNRLLEVFALKNQMIVTNERFYFSPDVLKDEATRKFDLKPLRKTKETSRFKIYIHGAGKSREFQHMAVRLAFHKSNSQWFLQVDPDWYFSYPQDHTKTRRDIGIRITREKANTFNEQYLYLLHAWKQFLSNSSDKIVFKSENLESAQAAVIDTSNLSFESDFMLFNDYVEPRKNENES